MKKKKIFFLIIFIVILFFSEKALCFRFPLKSIDITLKRLGYKYVGPKKGKKKGEAEYIWKHSKLNVRVIVYQKIIVDTALVIEFPFKENNPINLADKTLTTLLFMNLGEEDNSKKIAKMVSNCTVCKFRNNPDCQCKIDLKDFQISYYLEPKISDISSYVIVSKWILPF